MANLTKHFITGVKGFGMGAANVIPGVSGGTIALLTGIFTELIDALNALMDPSSLETAPVRQIQRILEIHPRSIPGITFRRSSHKHILIGQTDGIRHGLPPDTDMGIFLRTHHRLLGVYDLRYQRMEST